MKDDMEPYRKNHITDKILGAFYRVYNKLGYGFLEKVYENALSYELKRSGLSVINQAPIKVIYEKEVVGEYFADLLVEDEVIVEVKASKRLAPEHTAQLLNYLKATDKELGLLLNFGTRPEIQRKIYDNSRK
jgi:GxxExxY protein